MSKLKIREDLIKPAKIRDVKIHLSENKFLKAHKDLMEKLKGEEKYEIINIGSISTMKVLKKDYYKKQNYSDILKRDQNFAQNTSKLIDKLKIRQNNIYNKLSKSMITGDLNLNRIESSTSNIITEDLLKSTNDLNENSRYLESEDIKKPILKKIDHSKISKLVKSMIIEEENKDNIIEENSKLKSKKKYESISNEEFKDLNISNMVHFAKRRISSAINLKSSNNDYLIDNIVDEMLYLKENSKKFEPLMNKYSKRPNSSVNIITNIDCHKFDIFEFDSREELRRKRKEYKCDPFQNVVKKVRAQSKIKSGIIYDIKAEKNDSINFLRKLKDVIISTDLKIDIKSIKRDKDFIDKLNLIDSMVSFLPTTQKQKIKLKAKLNDFELDDAINVLEEVQEDFFHKIKNYPYINWVRYKNGIISNSYVHVDISMNGKVTVKEVKKIENEEQTTKSKLNDTKNKLKGNNHKKDRNKNKNSNAKEEKSRDDEFNSNSSDSMKYNERIEEEKKKFRPAKKLF